MDSSVGMSKIVVLDLRFLGDGLKVQKQTLLDVSLHVDSDCVCCLQQLRDLELSHCISQGRITIFLQPSLPANRVSAQRALAWSRILYLAVVKFHCYPSVTANIAHICNIRNSMSF